MPPPLSITVIMNADAGTAMGRPQLGREIAELFRAAGRSVDIIEVHKGQSPVDAARRASAYASIVVAAGGDGTVNAVMTGIRESPAALGVLPLGTLNHFAKDLHIPFDLPEAVAVVAAGHVRHVDVGQVDTRFFVNNSSIGLYPDIVEAREALRRQGHGKWPAMAIATWRVLRHYRGLTVSIDVDGQRRAWRTPFVFVGNNEYTIDGVGLGTRATLDEGKLFVYLAPRLHARQLPLLFVKALFGGARRSGDFEIVAATELWIDMAKARRMRVACDGEIRPMTLPFHYRACPKALPVVLPPL